MNVPLKSYVVCATKRSGSTLLARGLGAAALLGTPATEPLNPLIRQDDAARWGCEGDLEAYISAVHKAGTTPGGLFAAKVHWDQFVLMRAEAGAGTADPARYETADAFVDRLFPAPKFIRLIRMDLDAQAVSLWRAIDTDVWAQLADGSEPAEAARTAYSFERIDSCRRDIEQGELGWERLIRTRGAQALVVTYEQLASAYADTVRLVANYVIPEIDFDLPTPDTLRQSDQWSLELVERFRRERIARSGSAGRSVRRGSTRWERMRARSASAAKRN